MSDENFFGELANHVQRDLAPLERVPDELWHYTSSAGLLGIVSKHTIRFAEAQYMNDGSEIVWGLNMLKRSLDEFAKDKPSDHRQYAGRVFRDVLHVLDDQGVYICCFCERPNLLNQWRDYGKDDVAYCIGFELRELLRKGAFNFEVYLVNVIYNVELQQTLLNELCARLYAAVLAIPGLSELSANEGERYFADAAVQFASMVLRFKNPAFAAEEEWRLVSHRPSVARGVERMFRPSGLGVIPYYEWSRRPKKRPLPITKVVVGPSPYGEISERALRALLEETGYDGAITSYSTIPIRR